MKHLLHLLFFCFPIFISAQTISGSIDLSDENQRHFLKTVDGDEMLGQISEMTDAEITFDFRGNKIIFKKDEIISIKVIENKEKKLEKGTFQTTERNEKIVEKPVAQDTLLPFPIDKIASPLFDMNNPLQKHLLYTNTDDRFVGRVTNIGRIVEFVSASGFKLTFKLDEVRLIDVVGKNYFFKKSKNGDYLIVSSIKDLTKNETTILGQNRLFISQTGFGLKKGEKEYRNTMLFMNEFNFGFSDNFSAGIGIIPFITVNFTTFNIKTTFSASEYVHFGAGLHGWYGFAFDQYTDNVGGISPFVAASFGTPTGFINFSYNRWRFDDYEKGGLYGIGFSIKSSEKFRLYADVYLYRSSMDSDYHQNFILLGGSWFNSKNKVDFGFGAVPYEYSEVGFIPFPMVGYTKRF